MDNWTCMSIVVWIQIIKKIDIFTALSYWNPFSCNLSDIIINLKMIFVWNLHNKIQYVLQSRSNNTQIVSTYLKMSPLKKIMIQHLFVMVVVIILLVMVVMFLVVVMLVVVVVVVSSVWEGGGGWHELDGTIGHVELTSSLPPYKALHALKKRNCSVTVIYGINHPLPSYKALHALKKKETAVYQSSMGLTTLCPHACTAADGVNQPTTFELACMHWQCPNWRRTR